MTLLNFLLFIPHRINSRFVHDALELSTREAVGFFSYFFKIDFLAYRFIDSMQLQDMKPTLFIRQIHLNMTVKTAWTQ
ncbi:hypothetical protein D1872_265360 [compost metagenome]